MTQNERRLINLIRNNPDKAEIIAEALDIMIALAQEPQECEEQFPDSAAEFF